MKNVQEETNHVVQSEDTYKRQSLHPTNSYLSIRTEMGFIEFGSKNYERDEGN